MAKTIRNQRHNEVFLDRPEWQDNRGPRHGNNRKMYAKLKVDERRRDRSNLSRELRQDFATAEF